MAIYTKTYVKDDEYLVDIAGERIFVNLKDAYDDACFYYLGELKYLDRIIDIENGTHDKITIICRRDEDLLEIDDLIEKIKQAIYTQYEKRKQLNEVKQKFTKEGKYNILLEIPE